MASPKIIIDKKGFLWHNHNESSIKMFLVVGQVVFKV